MFARAIFNTSSLAALALASGLVMARAEPAPADHSKMDHGAMDHSAHGAAAAQWADPGKGAGATADAAKPAEAGKADEHAGHHGGGASGGGMGGMNHGGGGMMGGMGGGMGGMMGGGAGGMDHGGGKGGGGMMGGGMGGMMSHMLCGFAEHLEGRLAYLKAELKLTDQQVSAWNGFADAWRGAAQKAQAKCAAPEDHADHAKAGILGKLDMMDKHMSDHLEIVRAQKAAIEPFFTALSEEQKKIASETMTSVMKVGMSMGGGMTGGGGMMGGMGGMNHGGSGGGMGGGMGGMQH